MEEWEKKKITEAIEALKKEEARQFAVVYATLEEKNHGFLQALPQQTKIWYKEVDAEYLKELKNTHGWDKVSAWGGSTFYKISMPYLSLDGALEMFHKDHPDGKISIEFTELKDKIIVMAVITGGDRRSIGAVDLDYQYKDKKLVKDENGNPVFENVEIPVSNAIRKALGYFGYGRFPTHKTEYGDHPLVTKFREFVINEKNPNV